MEKEMISIIMSVYNAERYLKDALESIYESTYQNFEVICINDGSTDNSKAICKEFQNKYNNFVYLSQSNHGLAYSRNVGMRMASGYYITFVDADDLIHKDMLKIMSSVMSRYDAQVVYTPLLRFTSKAPFGNLKKKIKVTIRNSESALQYYLREKKGNVCGGLFKTDLIKRYKFPDGLIYEDNVVKAQVLLEANKIVFLDMPLYAYRKNLKSITASKTTVKNMDILKIGFELSRIIKSTDIRLYKKYIVLLYNMISETTTKNLKQLKLNNEEKNKILNMVPKTYFLKIMLFAIWKEPSSIRVFLQLLLR